jgi:hypothetical protein
MLTKEELNKMSEKDLAILADEKGLSLNSENTPKKVFVDEILLAQEQDEALKPTEVEVVTADPDEVEVEVILAEKPVVEKRFKIVVANQEGVEATPFIKVVVNGNMYIIPREVEVVVPESVIEVLNNAIVTRFTQEGRELVARSAKRFPFSIMGRAK